MILTNCAACAAPLAHDAPRCIRCHTRYCNKTCQHDHWRRGHKQMCKKIHRGGNAEQYHADKKYKEAVAEAVEACADDTKGQTCYICTQALHWKTKEGLVRMCACRGTAGFAHVSCLAEEVKILYAEAEENNLDLKVKHARWMRWYTCSLCEQEYHGVVAGALGWAVWKTYLGRPEGDEVRRMAMNLLGGGLTDANHKEDAMVVYEAELAMERRLGSDEERMLVTQGNLANVYQALGRYEEALSTTREIYAGFKSLYGSCHSSTLLGAFNLGLALNKLGKYAETKSLLHGSISDAQRTLGDNHKLTLDLRSVLADTLACLGGIDNLSAAVAMREDVYKRTRQIFGPLHPKTQRRQRSLEVFRAALADVQAGRPAIIQFTSNNI